MVWSSLRVFNPFQSYSVQEFAISLLRFPFAYALNLCKFLFQSLIFSKSALRLRYIIYILHYFDLCTVIDQLFYGIYVMTKKCKFFLYRVTVTPKLGVFGVSEYWINFCELGRVFPLLRNHLRPIFFVNFVKRLGFTWCKFPISFQEHTKFGLHICIIAS